MYWQVITYLVRYQQDFYLDLVEDNRRITPRDYLEIALKPMQGAAKDTAAKNEVVHNSKISNIFFCSLYPSRVSNLFFFSFRKYCWLDQRVHSSSFPRSWMLHPRAAFEQRKCFTTTWSNLCESPKCFAYLMILLYMSYELISWTFLPYWYIKYWFLFAVGQITTRIQSWLGCTYEVCIWEN